MISLENFGWNTFFHDYYDKNTDKHLKVGRVISIKGFKYALFTQTDEIEAELSGKLLYASLQEELPKVGDWVFFTLYGDLGYIIDVFPRVNQVFRKTAGKKNDRQILAANVDYALIVQSLDSNFNLMRIERYLVQMVNCNIKPVVILNKADLVLNPEEYVNEVSKLNRDCPVYLCSTYSRQGIEALKNEVLEEFKTYILIGSSGVGKSSLLNALMETEVMETNETSDSTGKGKHTTTTRDLFQLPSGSLLIDTPGMREFGLAVDSEQPNNNLFPAVEDFAGNCRYADCTHVNESGCAVIEAVEKGNLSTEVYESYLKLIKEQRHFDIKIEDRKRLGKQFGKLTREAKEYRKKYKY